MRVVNVLAVDLDLSLIDLIQMAEEQGYELTINVMSYDVALQALFRTPPDVAVFHIPPDLFNERIATLSDVVNRSPLPILLLSESLEGTEAEKLRGVSDDCMISDDIDEGDLLSWILAQTEDRAQSLDNGGIITLGIENPLGNWSYDLVSGSITIDGEIPGLLGLNKNVKEIHLDDLMPLLSKSTLRDIEPLLKSDGKDCSQSFQKDIDLKGPGGSFLSVAVKGRRVIDPENDTRCIEGIAFDRHQDNNSLCLRSERDHALKWLVEHGDDLIIMGRPDGEISYFNPAMENFIRKHMDGSTNHHIADILNLDRKAFERGLFRNADVCMRFKRRYGLRSRWIEWSVSPVPMENGSTLVCRGKDVTEEVASRLELESLYENITSFVNNTPGVLFRCRDDASYTMLSISDEIEDLVGYPSSDFINNSVRSYTSIIHPDDFPMVYEEVGNAVQNEKEYILRYRLKSAEGEDVWVQENAQPIKDRDGNLTIYGILTDVTDYLKMEAALQESLSRYKSLFNNMQTGFAEQKLLFDESGEVIGLEYVDVNPAFESETGLPVSVIGHPIKEVMPNFEEFWYNAFVEVGLTRVPKRLTNYVADVDRWFDVFIFSPQKGHVAQIFLNTTEKERLSNRIAESEEKYRSLFNTMPVAFSLCEVDDSQPDFSFRVLEMNPSMKDLSKRSSSNEVDIPHRHAWLPIWESVVRDQRPIEFEDRLPDSEIWVNVIAFPASDDRFAVFITDISERIAVENNLKAALDEKSLLLQELNHRVGNNLQMMISMLQLQIIKVEGKADAGPLIRTQNRLTAMARAYQQIYSTGPGEAIDFGVFVRNLADDVLENTPGGGPFNVRVDDLRINVTLESLVYVSFILNELITNSAVYARQGRDSASIDIGMELIDGKLHIVYSDDGPGMNDLEPIRNDPENVGMRMVISMVERQLGGSVVLFHDPWGLAITIGNLRKQTWVPLS